MPHPAIFSYTSRSNTRSKDSILYGSCDVSEHEGHLGSAWGPAGPHSAMLNFLHPAICGGYKLLGIKSESRARI